MMVEILFIDTAGSRKLYQSAKLNSAEKAKAQGLLKEQFREACAKHGGEIRAWNGDGGFAFFSSRIESEFGKSVEAAKDFLKSIPHLDAQTALAFDVPEFTRSVRITAHRGEIFISGDASIDSANPENFDDFIKGEKKFAPENDELFITSQLYSALSANIKRGFQFHEKVKFGSLSTDIHRLKKTPIKKTHDIFKLGDELSKITQAEWNYLKGQIVAHSRNVAARNEITKGLIRRVWQTKKISNEDILELTLDSLYAYLCLTFQKYKFRITYWRYSKEKSGDEFLTIAGHRYPKGENISNPSRKVPINDQQFQVCRVFRIKEALATPSVVSARNTKPILWFDFYNGQANKKRHLASAMQIPVYHRNEANEKIMHGVLCLDSDKMDTFLQEEIPLWTEELIGYLANISLSESMHQLAVNF